MKSDRDRDRDKVPNIPNIQVVLPPSVMVFFQHKYFKFSWHHWLQFLIAELVGWQTLFILGKIILFEYLQDFVFTCFFQRQGSANPMPPCKWAILIKLNVVWIRVRLSTSESTCRLSANSIEDLLKQWAEVWVGKINIKKSSESLRHSTWVKCW